MNCRKLQNLISAYIDSELAGVEMLAVREHLRVCRPCTEEYGSILLIKRSFGKMASKKPSLDLAMKICCSLPMESEAGIRRPVTLPRLNLHPLLGRFRYAAVGAGIIGAFLILSAGSMRTSYHNNRSGYHIEMGSLINDEQHASTGKYDGNAYLSFASSARRKGQFNLPWGLSRQPGRPAFFSDSARMALASYNQ